MAGNHDVEVLPRLADQIPEFKLIGRGGRWETVDVYGPDGSSVRIAGWSFHREKEPDSPLDSFRTEPTAGRATLGVLHCDLGKLKSDYAPVTRSQLERSPVAAWFLGHVHKPSLEPGPRPIGYLGSLVGLDPGEGERGEHGPWLVEVAGEVITECRQLLFAPVRFEVETIPLDGMEVASANELETELTSRITSGLKRVAERCSANGTPSPCKVVSCRLQLTGRTRHHREVRTLVASGELQALQIMRGHTRVGMELIEDRAEPELDLVALAQANDPPGLLAQDLQALATNSAEAADLVRGAAEAARRIADSGDYALLGKMRPDGDDVRARLTRVTRALLEDVLAMNGGGASSS